MNSHTADKPTWATYADHMTDASDVWQKQTDPENEFGEACTACFEVNSVLGYSSNPAHDGLTVWECTLSGLIVDDGHGLRFLDRPETMWCIGYDAVRRLENSANEVQREAA